MAFDQNLADRIRRHLKDRHTAYSEKNMFGGLCFMVDNKMCLGIVKDDLMARVNPEEYEAWLDETGCRQMDFTGKPMKGYVFVSPDGVDHEDDLERWIERCLAFNPLAKASKKK